MDIRFLESLIAVVETGSIAGAARLQFLTAAAVSQRIQALEKDLDCELLSRSGHAAKPTQTCLNLLPRAKRLVREAQALKGDIDQSVLTGTLRIGAISTVLTGLLPLVLRRLVAAAPKVVPKIIPGTSKALFDALLADTLDAALLVEPPFTLPKSLAQQDIRQEPLLLLSKGMEGRSLQQILSTEPYICYDSKSWGGRVAERYLVDNRLYPATLCELDALEAIQILVGKELGVSLVPYWSGLQPEENQLSVHLIEDERYLRRIVLITPVLPPQSKIIKIFKQCLFS